MLKNLLFLPLLLLFLNTNAQHKAFYISATADNGLERLNQSLMLSDSTLLVAGEARNMNWLPAGITPTILDTTGFDFRSSSGTIGFIVRLSKDLNQILNVVTMPPNSATNIYKIRTDRAPGEPTGNIYISGETDGFPNRNGYFLAKLNNNFINGVPTGFKYIRQVRVGAVSSGKTQFDGKSWHQSKQPWDVDRLGRITYASREEFSFNWSAINRLDSMGNNAPTPGFTNHVVRYSFNGDTTYFDPNAGPQNGVPGPGVVRNCETVIPIFRNVGDSIFVRMRYRNAQNSADSFVTRKLPIVRHLESYVMMKYAGTNGRCFRSITQEEYDFLGLDENNQPRRASMPDNYLYSGACETLTDSTILCSTTQTPGFYGHRAPNGQMHTGKVGDIAIDKRNNHIYIGYTYAIWNAKSQYQPNTAFNFGGFDYDATVVALNEDGVMKWWGRMLKQDTAGTGFSANHFADGLAIDYTNNDLLVLVNGFGQSTSNLYRGDQLAASPLGSGVKNQLSNDAQTIFYAWLGRYDLNVARLKASTYISEYATDDKSAPGFPDPNLAGWPNPNFGNSSYAPTVAHQLSVDSDGSPVVLGASSRSITTENAYMRMYKADRDLCLDSLASQSHFIRRYSADLQRIAYSTLFNGALNPTLESQSPNILVNGVLPLGKKYLVTGTHQGFGSLIPVNGVPAYGKATPSGLSGVIALLDENCVVPAEPVSIFGKATAALNGGSMRLRVATVPGATNYNWQVGNVNWSIVANGDTARVTLGSNAAPGFALAAGVNACGIGTPRGRALLAAPRLQAGPAENTIRVVGPGFTQYIWVNNGVPKDTTTVPTLNVSNTALFQSGEFYAVIINDCFRDTTNSIVFNIVGNTELLSKNVVKAYPNPLNGTELTLLIPSDFVGTRASITDITGRLISTHLLNADKKQVINVGHINAGFYILSIEGRDGQSHSLRLVKQ
jgi:hypothetical protein